MLQIKDFCSSFLKAIPNINHFETISNEITPIDIQLIQLLTIKVTKEMYSKSKVRGYIPNNSFLKSE